MYYTVIKHDGHLRARGKCRKHEPFIECSQMTGFHTRKTIKHAFSMIYTLIKHGFLTNKSARRVISIF